ncbi:MAG: peptidoglycan-binding protein [Cyanobacteria bacterium SBLK]|nr:peptidoglycan-binding protein [Cyanobacteria bacterium SBLK]
METIAYNRGYLVREEMEGIEYDFPELDFSNFGNGAISSSLLAAAIAAGILTMADPAMARMLTRGMQGNDVAEVQMLLRNRGYAIRYGASGAGRGKFGPQTENAVRAFQQKMGLTPDGIVGSRTLTALKNGTGGRQNNASVRVATSSTGGTGGYLTIGSRGNGVAELQTLLRNRGYAIRYGANGAGRGVFGEQTLTALRRFQRDARLAVDGVAGPRTMSALRGGSVSASAGTIRQASTNVRQASASTNGRYRVATGGSRLNIRNRPSLNGGVVGTLANGATVNAIARPSSGWVQIGSGQFVARRYLR